MLVLSMWFEWNWCLPRITQTCCYTSYVIQLTDMYTRLVPVQPYLHILCRTFIIDPKLALSISSNDGPLPGTSPGPFQCYSKPAWSYYTLIVCGAVLLSSPWWPRLGGARINWPNLFRAELTLIYCWTDALWTVTSSSSVAHRCLKWLLVP